MEKEILFRYQSCTLTDLAGSADVDLRTFQDWLTPDDLISMIQLGWNPFAKKLKPPVVRYLRTKFIDKTLDAKPTNQTP